MHAGTWKAVGAEWKQSSIASYRDSSHSFIALNVKRPFGVSSSKWKRSNCNSASNILNETLIRTNQSRLYHQFMDLVVIRRSKTESFKVFNPNREPSIRIYIPSSESILSSIYPNSTVLDDHTLHGVIVRQSKYLHVKIHGKLLKCPGYFGLHLADGESPEVTIAHYDIIVKCPERFQVTVKIPSKCDDTVNRTFIATIKDSHRAITVRILKPANQIDKHTYGN